ncbi:Cof-type HAD-IIB family hydrolase [Ornithinibacillus californiensis]|uniref:Cof-type HAD-IIB family hydrolase n=1 Tax=Ornithinibacillus californiensis TaxID=161536 RepID=UPI00064DE972|nr:Cof-type HAD-IIB family hydrolase [Ornithinibacillus californiensis]
MKLIALDLDGTTFNSKHEISRENLEAIQEAQEQGHKVMVLSGRALDEIKPDLEKYELRCPIGANNGASLYIRNQVVHMIPMQADQINKIALELDKEFIPYRVTTNKGVFTPKDYIQRLEKVLTAEDAKEKLEMYKAFSQRYGHQLINQIDDILNDQSISIQKYFVYTLDPIQKTRFESFLNSIDDLYIASTPLFMDIMHHQASKGNALKYMAEYFNIPHKDTVAIGDEVNDITMFNMAGLSIAMGNASEQVKKHSDVVTLTNDEHGVAYAINNYVLNEKYSFYENDNL